LSSIAHFMSLEPLTGFGIINNLLGILRLNIPLHLPVVRHIAKQILLRELNMYFARIRKEDESLSFDRLEEYSEEDIDSICFRRGIDIDNQTKKEKI